MFNIFNIINGTISYIVIEYCYTTYKHLYMQLVHKMFFHTLGLERAREYSVPLAEVYVHKSNLFLALSPDPSKYPIYLDFHHTNHAWILWAGLTSRMRVLVGAR